MKTRSIILGLLIVSSSVIYAQSEKVMKSKVDHVTVFLQGAQIYRNVPISLAAGSTKIVFDNLEAGIDVKSLQASGNGNFVIMDVAQLIKYPEPQTVTVDPANVHPKNLRLIKAISDSIQSLSFDLEDISNKKQVLETEKNTLLNNRLIKGEFKKDSLAILKDALEFLRTRLNNINSEALKLKREDVKLNSVKASMQERLTALQNFNSNPGQIVPASTNPSYQVVVTVSADALCAGTVEISYLVQGAGWTPSYDLRAKDANSTMQLTYKANVFQNTGSNWDNVKLKLSTGNPNQNNIKPILTAWYLDYYIARSYRSNARYEQVPALAAQNAGAVESEAKMKEDAVEKAAESAANFTTFIETATNFEFDIKLGYSVPSDNVGHLVSVKNEEIPASFMHYAVPKLDHDAFLVARVTGWEDLNLMPGKANVFFDGTFVGESFIDPANTNDTLNLTLGRDKSVVLTRIKLKDKTKDKVINNDRVQTITYEITVRNTKSTTLTMMLEDQIPVSNNKNIVVEVLDIAGATRDADTGILHWKLNIKPKETKKIQVSYSVKFSKDKTLSAGLL